MMSIITDLIYHDNHAIADLSIMMTSMDHYIMTPIITDLLWHHYCMISPSSAEPPWWILYAVIAKLSTHYPCKHHFGRDWPFSLSLVYLTLIHWLLPLQPHWQRIVNNFCPDFPTPEEKQKVSSDDFGSSPSLGWYISNNGMSLFCTTLYSYHCNWLLLPVFWSLQCQDFATSELPGLYQNVASDVVSSTISHACIVCYYYTVTRYQKVVIYANTVISTHLNYVYTSRHLFISSSVCLFFSVCLCLPVCLFTLKTSLQKYPRNACGYPSQKMEVSETSQNQPPNVRFFLLLYLFNMHWVTTMSYVYGACYALCCVFKLLLCFYHRIVFTIIYIQLGRLSQYLPGDSSCDTCKMWAQVLKPIFSNNKLLVHVNLIIVYHYRLCVCLCVHVCGDCECMCVFIHIGLYTTCQIWCTKQCSFIPFHLSLHAGSLN